MTTMEKIDAYIQKTNDWRGDVMNELRKLIHEVEPNIEEEWKWNSPVFSLNGKMICSPGAFKTHVGINFFDGAIIEDIDGLFNGGSDAKKSRSINLQNGDRINQNALKSLLTRAISIHKH